MTENTPTPAELVEAARVVARQYAGTHDPVIRQFAIAENRIADALEAVTAERDARDAVIERVKVIVYEALREADDSGNGWDAEVSASALDEILSTAPATVLAQVKADAWDEGCAHARNTSAPGHWENRPGGVRKRVEDPEQNPYRTEAQ